MNETHNQEHPGEPYKELEQDMRTWPEGLLHAKSHHYDHTLLTIPVSFLLNLLDRVRILEQSMAGEATLQEERGQETAR